MGWSFSSTGATRLQSNWGTSITPGNNTMGSYAQVLSAANVANDVVWVEVSANSNGVSTAARDTIMDIGVDPAGGTAYNVLIPQILVSQAGPALQQQGGVGINYCFPLYITAGSTVAARASVNNATVGTLRVRMRITGMPKDHRNMIVGTRCVAIGITAGSSTGVSVTSGAASEGTWTSLGTVAAGDNPWFWQYGVGINQGTTTAVGVSGDLSIGNASNKVIVMEDRTWNGTVSENWTDDGARPSWYQAAAGDTVYGRLQCSGTALSGLSMAAWGVI